MEIMYERVAAIDVGKKIIAVAVHPGEQAGKRRQQVRKSTLSPDAGQMGRGWCPRFGM